MRFLIAALLLIHAPAAATAQAAPFRLEPVTRIGCVECDGPEMFTLHPHFRASSTRREHRPAAARC